MGNLSRAWVIAIAIAVTLTGTTVGWMLSRPKTDSKVSSGFRSSGVRTQSRNLAMHGPEIAHLEIGATAEQSSRIEALYRNSALRRKALHARLREQMRSYSALFEHYEIDIQQQAVLRDGIVQTQNDLLQVQLDTEQQLRHILTSEQFTRMSTLLHQRRRHSTFGSNSTSTASPMPASETPTPSVTPARSASAPDSVTTPAVTEQNPPTKTP